MDRVSSAVELAKQIRWNGAGTCCCHICIDDPNEKDHNVAFCIRIAAKRGHPDCLALALVLARCSYTQRRKVRRLAWV